MNGQQWTIEQIGILKTEYPNRQTVELVELIGRDIKSIYSKAALLKLRKSEDFLKSDKSGRLSKLMSKGFAHRFKKGNKVWNKGMKGLDIGGKETRFKKGQRSINQKPVGSERLSKDGYIEIKVADPNKWKSKHSVEWEKVNGKIPKGHIVVFKTEDKLNVSIDNLELITRAENMKRNTVHNYPKEISLTVQLRGALNRQINKHIKKLSA